jgi:hypothetical protein
MRIVEHLDTSRTNSINLDIQRENIKTRLNKFLSVDDTLEKVIKLTEKI